MPKYTTERQHKWVKTNAKHSVFFRLQTNAMSMHYHITIIISSRYVEMRAKYSHDFHRSYRKLADNAVLAKEQVD